MPAGRKLLASQVEQIRLDYTDPERTVAQAADAAGVATSTVRALAKKHGWERRRHFANGPDHAVRRPGPGEALGAQLSTLERATSRSVLALERALAAGDAPDPERAARALATHARTIAGLHKLQAARVEEPAPDDEPPPRTLNELRDELRRHLERIRSERRTRGVPEDPDQG